MNKLLADSSNYTAGRTGGIEYIVIHYTANNGDTAKGNCNYFAQPNRNASAHYFADSGSVWQSVEDNNTAWHCGANVYYHKYCRNANSLGVELCSHIDSKGEYYFDDDTVSNAAALVRELKAKYNVPIANVVRHYDVTHKTCPAPFVKNVTAWNNFKKSLEVKDVVNSYDEAAAKLVEAGVIATREYWDNAVKCVKYLDTLFINMANKL